MEAAVVVNNPANHRFELSANGQNAFLTYQLKPDSIVFVHTEVPKELEGGGVGGKLVRAGLEFAREQGLKAVPLCPFVSGYVKRHPEYLDLVPAEDQARLSTKLD